MGNEAKFFWDFFSVGNIVTIIAMIVAVSGFIYVMRDRIDTLGKRMSTVEIKLEKIVEVLIHQGRQDERIARQDERFANIEVQINQQGKRVDELYQRLQPPMPNRRDVAGR